MLSRNNTDERVQKSLKERFLLVLGILFFILYFILGIIIIFWKGFSTQMEQKYRIAFGILIIVYSFIRFTRLIKKR
jgi:uncharacterized membrane protein (DUF485 family)